MHQVLSLIFEAVFFYILCFPQSFGIEFPSVILSSLPLKRKICSPLTSLSLCRMQLVSLANDVAEDGEAQGGSKQKLTQPENAPLPRGLGGAASLSPRPGCEDWRFGGQSLGRKRLGEGGCSGGL